MNRPDVEIADLRPEELRFDESGLIPAVVQDAATREVLMVAYMNAESLAKTLESGLTWFYSRSRAKLWQKGETSGNTQRVVAVRYDCDADCLLVLVEPAGPACHTGATSCFYRSLVGQPAASAEVGSPPATAGTAAPAAPSHAVHLSAILSELESVIAERKTAMPEGSYTAKLLAEGVGKIGAKVEEEAEEVARAAREESDERVASEAADVLYHLLVLLAARDVGLETVAAELTSRR